MINHVEKYIGTISHGSKSDSESQYKLNIAAIPSSPNRDLKTYITLGLSKHDLNYKSRFEILFVCSLKYDENQIFPFLRWLAETIIENKKILLRGQVIYLPRSIVDSTKMDALYVSAPFYFDAPPLVMTASNRCAASLSNASVCAKSSGMMPPSATSIPSDCNHAKSW